MNEEMMDLYKQLSLSNKRNELSSLLLKIDTLLNAVLVQNNIQNNASVKNYDTNIHDKFNEDEMLVFFYEDLWLLKNKLLLLLVSKEQ